MLSDDQLAAALDALPGERVTDAYIKSRITEVKFHRFGTLTHCTIHLDNGFMVTGESACVDPVNYRKELGEKIAHDNAFAKLWPLFGFLLSEARFRRAESLEPLFAFKTRENPSAVVVHFQSETDAEVFEARFPKAPEAR